MNSSFIFFHVFFLFVGKIKILTNPLKFELKNKTYSKMYETISVKSIVDFDLSPKNLRVATDFWEYVHVTWILYRWDKQILIIIYRFFFFYSILARERG